jgi:hypothetical protein
MAFMEIAKTCKKAGLQVMLLQPVCNNLATLL